MNEDLLIEQISKKDPAIDTFVAQVLEDSSVREIVLKHLFNNTQIMVYYHCYYIVLKASAIHPSLFYGAWDSFAELLNHKNSYHRDIGLTIIANLTAVDEENKFDTIYDDYIKCFNDPKFMTADCFVNNLKKIVVYKPQYERHLIELLMRYDEVCDYTDKQKALMVSSIVEVFETLSTCTEVMGAFVEAHKNSISPKTRKVVLAFLNRRKQ